MHAVFFQGNLLAIAVEQIHIIAIITSVYKIINYFIKQIKSIVQAKPCLSLGLIYEKL